MADPPQTGAPADPGVTDSGISLKFAEDQSSASPQAQPDANLVAGGAIPTAVADQPAPQLKDSMVEARLNGYDWPAIDQHVAQFQNAAAHGGYTQQQVDDHVGKPTPLDQFTPLETTQVDLDPKLPATTRPFAPGEQAQGTDGTTYDQTPTVTNIDGKSTVVPSTWLVNGTPTSLSSDQAGDMAKASGLAFPSFNTDEEAEQAAKQPVPWSGPIGQSVIPDPKAAVDYPIGVVQNSGVPPTTPLVKQTQGNMLDMAVKTGMPFDQIYKATHTDPLIQDAVMSDNGTPQDKLVRQTIDAYQQKEAQTPTKPTLADIEANDKAINPVYFPFLGDIGAQLIVESGRQGFAKGAEGAGENLAAWATGELAGKYVVKPLLHQLMKVIKPSPVREFLGKSAGEVIPLKPENQTGTVSDAPPPPFFYKTGQKPNFDDEQLAVHLGSIIDKYGEGDEFYNELSHFVGEFGKEEPVGANANDLVKQTKIQRLLKTIQDIAKDQSGELKPGKPRKFPKPPKAVPLEAPSWIDWTASRGGQTVLEDELNRLRTNVIDSRIDAGKTMDAAGRENPAWLTDKFQEDAYNYGETRGKRSLFVKDPEMEKYFIWKAGREDLQHSLATWIDRETHGKAETYDPSLRIRHGTEGYVHRIREEETPGPALPGTPEDVITSGGPTGNSLTRWASGMQQREQHFMIDDGAGNRKWFPDTKNFKAGEKINDPVTNKIWTVDDATSKEIEANTDIKYQKNDIINTEENIARLKQVKANMQFLDKAAKEMEAQGHFVPKNKPGRPIGKAWSGKIIFGQTANEASHNGMKEVNIPQMEGWAEPRAADSLNAFYNGGGIPGPANDGGLLGALRKSTQFLLNWLFTNPIVHGANVTMNWGISRGWDWVRPHMYGSLVRNTVDAAREVFTQGPKFRTFLQNGSAMQVPSVEGQNFMAFLHGKMVNDQAADPKTWGAIFKALVGDTTSDGEALKRGIQAEMKWSHQTLWQWSNILMMSRLNELAERGMPIREAIFQAEKDNINYRLPSQILGKTWASQAMSDPAVSTFGRYHVGMARSIALMARDLMKGSAGDRWDAAGKAVAMATAAYAILPLISYGVSSVGRALTGNPNFKVETFPGILRPVTALARQVTPLIHGAGVKLTGNQNFGQLPAALGGGDLFFKGQQNLISTVTTMLDIAPWVKIFGGLANDYGAANIWGNRTALGMAMSMIETAGDQFYPAQLALMTLKPSGVAKAISNVAAFKVLPTDTQETDWQKKAQAQAYSQERHDSLEQWVQDNIGGGPPPVAGRTKGSREKVNQSIPEGRHQRARRFDEPQ